MPPNDYIYEWTEMTDPVIIKKKKDTTQPTESTTTTDNTTPAVNSLPIDCSPDKFRRGTCTFNYYKTLNIRTSNTSSNPTVFIQDLVLTATSFVGTMMVVALIVMWWKYVMGGMDESSTGDLKGNIKKLIIGLGLVIGSYTIIRIVQYIAKGF